MKGREGKGREGKGLCDGARGFPLPFPFAFPLSPFLASAVDSNWERGVSRRGTDGGVPRLTQVTPNLELTQLDNRQPRQTADRLLAGAVRHGGSTNRKFEAQNHGETHRMALLGAAASRRGIWKSPQLRKACIFLGAALHRAAAAPPGPLPVACID